MSVGDTRVVFVSGLSGSGKSTAMAALEDLSFYCVDNLPPQLIDRFLDLCAKATPPIRKIALALDARETAFLRRLPEAVAQLRDAGAQVDVIFLECADRVLVNRYRETRRVHPLAPTGTVEEGVRRERHLLEEVVALADHVLDTSRLNVHQLREAIVRIVAGEGQPTVVNLVSFGYRYGTPDAAELLFDVRVLPNPHFAPELRARSGIDPAVAEYVLKNERAAALQERIGRLLEFLLGCYDAEGKAYLTIAVGCTGGRHRSVAVVEALARQLREAGRRVNVTHRDVERGE